MIVPDLSHPITSIYNLSIVQQLFMWEQFDIIHKLSLCVIAFTPNIRDIEDQIEIIQEEQEVTEEFWYHYFEDFKLATPLPWATYDAEQ
ncbi:hypothetical protein KI387_015334, partial [Taxus chinensis]